MVESVKRDSKSEDLAKARKRLKEKEKELVESGASRVLAKINKDPAMKKTFDQMTTSQQAQYISKQFTLGNASAGQAWVSYKSALNRCDGLEKEIQQGKANAQVKEDASKGNEAKKQVRRKRMTSRPRPIPKKVMEAANEQQAHSTYLEDSNHNRIYLIRSGNEPKARTLSLMFERNGEQVSETIPMNSAVMKLLNQARKMDKANADFSGIIENLNVERVKNNVTFKVDINDNESLGPVLQTPEEKTQEQPTVAKDTKQKQTPTITLVPHIKKNGKPSKKNFDIQLTDADGKVFILDKKAMKKAIKQQGNASATRGEMVDFSWNNYVEAAKEGKLSPETVASFFNGQANMGATNAKAAEQVKGVDIAPDMTINKPEKISLNVQNNAQNNNVETYLNTITNPGIVGRDNVVEKDKPKAVQNDAKPKEQEKVTTGGVVAVAKENGEVEVHKYNAKVEETTIDNKQPTTKTVTKTPDGISYSFDEKGTLSFSGAVGMYSPLSSEYLTPRYEKENSSKQKFGKSFGMADGAYKDKDGKYHCGGTTGTIYNVVVMAEKNSLKNIVAQNAVYNDLKRKEAKGSLSDAEKNFMKTHEKSLTDRGLIRCPDGVLEYKDCPEKDYNKKAHANAAALNMSIQRGTAKSETTTIHSGGGNTNVNTNTVGRGGME